MNYRAVGARLPKMVKNRSLGDREQGLERGVGGGVQIKSHFSCGHKDTVKMM